MSMFKASRRTAELVIRSQDERARNVRHLDVTHAYVPHLDGPLNLERVQEAIGERLLGLLGTAARWRATNEPGCARVEIITPEHRFIPEVESGLVEQLYLAQSAAGEVFRALLEDLSQWVRENVPASAEFGIEVDPTHRIYVRCPDLTPVLDPLDVEGNASIMDPLPGAELLATIRIVAPKGAESLAESSMARVVQCPELSDLEAQGHRTAPATRAATNTQGPKVPG